MLTIKLFLNLKKFYSKIISTDIHCTSSYTSKVRFRNLRNNYVGYIRLHLSKIIEFINKLARAFVLFSCIIRDTIMFFMVTKIINYVLILLLEKDM